jgi:mannosyltransferase OCH1-like enzyme
MIEKNIYQTYFTKILPDPIYTIINNHIANNPLYKYHFFDDNEMNDFVYSSFDNDIKTAYNALQIGAAKADFWRYLVLYKNGGVYIDMDSCINIPLDSFIQSNDTAIITRENNPNIFVQWGLFFAKDHPVLQKIIQYVTESILKYVNKKEPVYDETVLLKVTGPTAFSHAIETHFDFRNIRNKSLYDHTDEEIAQLIPSNRDDYVRVYGIDYNGACSFKHPYNMFLYEPYIQKKSWRDELKGKSLIKV